LVALFCAVAAAAFAADVLQQLHVDSKAAAREVLQSMTSGQVNYWMVRQPFKAAAPAARTALVEQTLLWTKAYVGSPQFAKDYGVYREEMKPRQPERKQTVDQEIEADRKKQQAEWEKTKKDIAQMPAQYRAAAEQGLKAAEAAQQKMDTPEFRNMQRQGIVQQRKQQDDDYAKRMAKWEKEYPADSKVLLKSRLQQFLHETADVDFAAKLNGGRFVDPRYEAKSSEWKLAFRAGKEPTGKARAFAQSWLAELK
ncbi:MAG TPA: hypothetical protein VEZ11_02945, partial [Thermoanaerobaculia bacterium]|nr:hypothetical protein [Thermoanaerobaculia bacterium]